MGHEEPLGLFVSWLGPPQGVVKRAAQTPVRS